MSTPTPLTRVGFVMHILQVAGAEVLVRETIRTLRDRVESTVFCLDGIGAIGEELQSEGVPVLSMDRRPGLDLKVARRLRHEIRDRGIEVLHAHQYTPFFYAALAKLGTGVRLILTEHGRHYPDIVSAKRRWINRSWLRYRCDRVNACSDFSRRALAENDGFDLDKIEVIENGIDLTHFPAEPDRGAQRRALGLPADRLLVAIVARFHPVKDHAMLLRAFERVAEERDDVDLLLVGDGPLRGTLEQQVERAQLGERVRFLGVRSDVPEILRAIDLFTLTSVSEAASLTLLEAMAASVPVVVTDVGGNPEIVRDGVEGRLVPRGDDVTTAQSILEVLGDPAAAEAMGRAGRRRVEEKYRLEDTIERYAGLYRSLAEGMRDADVP